MKKIIAVVIIPVFLICVLQLEAFSQTVKLKRPVGNYQYEFTSEETDPGGSSKIKIIVTLSTRDNGEEKLIFNRIGLQKKTDTAFANFILNETCRKELQITGSNEFTLRIDTIGNIQKAIPVCIPENLFGAITDLIAILFIQSKDEFGISSLSKTGDQFHFKGFETSWSRPPSLIEAKLSCAGGETRLESNINNIAILSWAPDPMSLSLVRKMDNDLKLFLDGKEFFVLTLKLDTKTGQLMEARSVRDDLDLQLWMQVTFDKIPSKENFPQSAGMDVRVTRKLNLKKISN